MLAKSIIIATVIAQVLAGQFSHVREKETIRLYRDPKPVLSNLDQNPYLSLSQEATEVKQGSDSIVVEVPSAKDTLERLRQRLSPKNLGSEFHDLKAFPGFHLKKGVPYAMKVTFIANAKAPGLFGHLHSWQANLYSTTLIKQVTYNTVTNTNGKQVSQPTYYEADFDYSVAVAPEEDSWELALKNTFLISPFQQGNFDDDDFEVSPPSVLPSSIIEITGLIRAPESGKYTMNMSKAPLAALYMGPGSSQIKTRYTIDASWNVLDTRSETSIELDLQKDEYYPFRFVVLGNDRDAKWVLDQTGPSGEKVDLFGLEKTRAPRMAAKQEDRLIFT
ncbi:hypothetical protein HF325_003872 [Metschnikowia pulcherrima]|uniref:GLEYA adhesin domain-containing protein n=1 Tax=Metschnikowia pulcherrima TaxID=27326 RepID=A0A8H7GRY3_9ASCO|nr:hypothetical protein HF325_003872 [Metschnikowia pulcherrima]